MQVDICRFPLTCWPGWGDHCGTRSDVQKQRKRGNVMKRVNRTTAKDTFQKFRLVFVPFCSILFHFVPSGPLVLVHLISSWVLSVVWVSGSMRSSKDMLSLSTFSTPPQRIDAPRIGKRPKKRSEKTPKPKNQIHFWIH